MRNQPRCGFCGRFFLADVRVGARQKSCGAPACRIKRKRAQEASWRVRNPDYFHGRYQNTKAWRAAHPGYQKAWRATKRGEIQTQIASRRPLGR